VAHGGRELGGACWQIVGVVQRRLRLLQHGERPAPQPVEEWQPQLREQRPALLQRADARPHGRVDRGRDGRPAVVHQIGDAQAAHAVLQAGQVVVDHRVA
jgi:hypothetical protein